jgi:hypothetical protein
MQSDGLSKDRAAFCGRLSSAPESFFYQCNRKINGYRPQYTICDYGNVYPIPWKPLPGIQ